MKASYAIMSAVTIMNVIPWCVAFLDRMSWFRQIADSEKLNIQGSNDMTSMLQANGGYRSKGIVVKVLDKFVHVDDGRLTGYTFRSVGPLWQKTDSVPSSASVQTLKIV
jgi:hypothetical protein